MGQPADGDETDITLKCAGAESVVIGSAHVQGCQLFQTLPSLSDEIAVPFLKHEVCTWMRCREYEGSLEDFSFLGCVSILKVADFLQDQDLVEAAVQAANAILIPSHFDSEAVSVSEDSVVAALQSLPAHLSQAVLRAGGQLQDWMRLLPPSCLPIMVPAAVDSGTLRLRPDEQGIEDLTPLLTVAKDCAAISNLEVTCSPKCPESLTVNKSVEPLAMMTQLKSLTLCNAHTPDLITLTALTHLRLDGCAAKSNIQTMLMTDISVFTNLKELTIVNILIPSTEEFSNQLRKLTALTSLQLRSPISELHKEAPIDEICKALTSGIAACTTLTALTLEHPRVCISTDTGPYRQPTDFSSPPLNKSTLEALSSLSRLTSLCLAVSAGCVVDPKGMDTVWQNMTALRSLTFKSESFLARFLPTVKHVPALEHFFLDSGSAVIPLIYHASSHSQIPSWFPTSLRSLKFHSAISCLPDLTSLPLLQSIELGGCGLWCPGETPPTLSQLTGLKMFSTGPPMCGESLFRELVQPNFDHTRELDLEMLVSGLPKTLCELRLPSQRPTEQVVATVATLPNLTYLDLGRVPRVQVMGVCGLFAGNFRSLRRLRIRWEEGAVCSPSARLVMGAFNSLPYFEELDHGPDPDGFWDPESVDGLKFRLVAD